MLNAKKIRQFVASLFVAIPASAFALQPFHAGYAFDNPRILVQQRLFGLAHGVTLLAAACAGEPTYRETSIQAYSEWNEQQAPTIATGYRDLAHYYFGDGAAQATRADIASALKLRARLDIKPGSKKLVAACSTFAEAIQKPRYNLRQQYLLQSLASRLAAAVAIESTIEVCRVRLAVEESARLDAAAAQWHQSFDVGVGEAKVTLEQQWVESQIDGTLGELLLQAREKGKRMAAAEHCNVLSQWLPTKKADPDDDFHAEP